MSSCPNINLAEWKSLEESVGTFEAYRDFMETDGMIRTPKEVQLKLREKSNYQLIRLAEDTDAASYEQIEELTARIAEKFVDNEYKLEELPDVDWKGKIELIDVKTNTYRKNVKSYRRKIWRSPTAKQKKLGIKILIVTLAPVFSLAVLRKLFFDINSITELS